MHDLNIPACAMYRQVGTVIVKTDDVLCRTCIAECSFARTYAKCEQCSRTNSPNSDCDSDIVKRCRTYKSSAARSRYVNVCAAVCLLLLVGGLSPQTSAAPHKRSNMDDAHRCFLQGKTLWENPCNYHPDDILPNGLPRTASVFEAYNARRVANQAKSAVHAAEEFKDLLAKNLYSYEKFDTLIPQWDDAQWLRTKYESLLGKYTFPSEKTRVDQYMPIEFLKQAMTEIDSVLPSVHKVLKIVTAAMYDIGTRGLDLDLEMEVALKDPFDALMNRCRQTLCYMNDLMAARSVEPLPLHDNELPDVRNADRLKNVLITFRDTMVFLDWLTELMDALARDTDGLLW